MNRLLIFTCVFYFYNLLFCQVDADFYLKSIDNDFFIENRGQWKSDVKFLARLNGLNIWITDQSIVYDYYKIDRDYSEYKDTPFNNHPQENFEIRNPSIVGQVLRLNFHDVSSSVFSLGKNESTTYFNYFLGNDLEKWVSNVSLYKNVAVQDIYSGISIHYYFDNGLLRYDFIVQANANLNQIRFNIEGENDANITESGELNIKTLLGEIIHGNIYAYQEEKGEKIEIKTNFIQYPDKSFGISAENYDTNKILIVDPLVYSTFIGGNNNDHGLSIQVSEDESIFLCGETFSSNFPTTIGAYQTTFGGGFYDAFVSKLSPNGSTLLYSTFLGGSEHDCSNSIAIDKNEYIYLTGQTYSQNFPVSASAFQSTYNGGGDIFITKLNVEGSEIIFSSFLGGSDRDQDGDLFLSLSNNVYMTGCTGSTDFPTTVGVFQTNYNGGTFDAFITKIDSIGSSLLYSTFLGKNSYDWGLSITVDSLECAYVVGETSALDFPLTSGAYQITYGGGSFDGFISKLNRDGSSLEYSTFLGGIDHDFCSFIMIDSGGAICVGGETRSSNFPTTSGVIQPNYGGGLSDGFITKINIVNPELTKSSFLGGSANDGVVSFDIGEFGNLLLTGWTTSSNFPITAGAYQTDFGGGTFKGDATFTILNSNLSTITNSSFLGGTSEDTGKSIKWNKHGNILIAGWTQSQDFPITNGAYQQSLNGGRDAFVSKFDLLTDITDDKIIFAYSLSQNYPNPFNPSTTIQYAISSLPTGQAGRQFVTLKIYDVLGKEIATLVNEEKGAGSYEIVFNASHLASGIYYYQLRAGDYVETKKMVYLK